MLVKNLATTPDIVAANTATTASANTAKNFQKPNIFIKTTMNSSLLSSLTSTSSTTTTTTKTTLLTSLVDDKPTKHDYHATAFENFHHHRKKYFPQNSSNNNKNYTTTTPPPPPPPQPTTTTTVVKTVVALKNSENSKKSITNNNNNKNIEHRVTFLHFNVQPQQQPQLANDFDDEESIGHNSNQHQCLIGTDSCSSSSSSSSPTPRPPVPRKPSFLIASSAANTNSRTPSPSVNQQSECSTLNNRIEEQSVSSNCSIKIIKTTKTKDCDKQQSKVSVIDQETESLDSNDSKLRPLKIGSKSVPTTRSPSSDNKRLTTSQQQPVSESIYLKNQKSGSLDSAQQVCCTQLALNIYTKALESAKKALPNKNKQQLKNSSGFPRSFGEDFRSIGPEGFHYLDDSQTECSFDYNDIEFNQRESFIYSGPEVLPELSEEEFFKYQQKRIEPEKKRLSPVIELKSEQQHFEEIKNHSQSSNFPSEIMESNSKLVFDNLGQVQNSKKPIKKSSLFDKLFKKDSNQFGLSRQQPNLKRKKFSNEKKGSKACSEPREQARGYDFRAQSVPPSSELWFEHRKTPPPKDRNRFYVSNVSRQSPVNIVYQEPPEIIVHEATMLPRNAEELAEQTTLNILDDAIREIRQENAIHDSNFEPYSSVWFEPKKEKNIEKKSTKKPVDSSKLNKSRKILKPKLLIKKFSNKNKKPEDSGSMIIDEPENLLKTDDQSKKTFETNFPENKENDKPESLQKKNSSNKKNIKRKKLSSSFRELKKSFPRFSLQTQSDSINEKRNTLITMPESFVEKANVPESPVWKQDAVIVEIGIPLDAPYDEEKDFLEKSELSEKRHSRCSNLGAIPELPEIVEPEVQSKYVPTILPISPFLLVECDDVFDQKKPLVIIEARPAASDSDFEGEIETLLNQESKVDKFKNMVGGFGQSFRAKMKDLIPNQSTQQPQQPIKVKIISGDLKNTSSVSSYPSEMIETNLDVAEIHGSKSPIELIIMPDKVDLPSRVDPTLDDEEFGVVFNAKTGPKKKKLKTRKFGFVKKEDSEKMSEKKEDEQQLSQTSKWSEQVGKNKQRLQKLKQNATDSFNQLTDKLKQQKNALKERRRRSKGKSPENRFRHQQQQPQPLSAQYDIHFASDSEVTPGCGIDSLRRSKLYQDLAEAQERLDYILSPVSGPLRPPRHQKSYGDDNIELIYNQSMPSLHHRSARGLSPPPPRPPPPKSYSSVPVINIDQSEPEENISLNASLSSLYKYGDGRPKQKFPRKQRVPPDQFYRNVRLGYRPKKSYVELLQKSQHFYTMAATMAQRSQSMNQIYQSSRPMPPLRKSKSKTLYVKRSMSRYSSPSSPPPPPSRASISSSHINDNVLYSDQVSLAKARYFTDLAPNAKQTSDVNGTRKPMDLSWQPFTWKVKRCRSLTELEVREKLKKQHCPIDRRQISHSPEPPYAIMTEQHAQDLATSPSSSSKQKNYAKRLIRWLTDSHSFTINETNHSREEECPVDCMTGKPPRRPPLPPKRVVRGTGLSLSRCSSPTSSSYAFFTDFVSNQNQNNTVTNDINLITAVSVNQSFAKRPLPPPPVPPRPSLIPAHYFYRSQRALPEKRDAAVSTSENGFLQYHCAEKEVQVILNQSDGLTLNSIGASPFSIQKSSNEDDDDDITIVDQQNKRLSFLHDQQCQASPSSYHQNGRKNNKKIVGQSSSESSSGPVGGALTSITSVYMDAQSHLTNSEKNQQKRRGDENGDKWSDDDDTINDDLSSLSSSSNYQSLVSSPPHQPQPSSINVSFLHRPASSIQSTGMIEEEKPETDSQQPFHSLIRLEGSCGDDERRRHAMMVDYQQFASEYGRLTPPNKDDDGGDSTSDDSERQPPTGGENPPNNSRISIIKINGDNNGNQNNNNTAKDANNRQSCISTESSDSVCSTNSFSSSKTSSSCSSSTFTYSRDGSNKIRIVCGKTQIHPHSTGDSNRVGFQETMTTLPNASQRTSSSGEELSIQKSIMRVEEAEDALSLSKLSSDSSSSQQESVIKVVSDGATSNETATQAQNVSSSRMNGEQKNGSSMVPAAVNLQRNPTLRENLSSLPKSTPKGAKPNKIYYCAHELYTTERDYVDVLKMLTKEFREAIRSYVTPIWLDQFFRPLDVVTPINQKLLQELEIRVLKEWDDNPKLSDIIIQICPYFKEYSIFIREFDRINLMLDDAETRFENFAQTLQSFQNSDRCRKLTIKSYLLKPIQRLPQYGLMLNQYLKLLNENQPEYRETERALYIVKEVVEHMEKESVNAERSWTLNELRNRIITTRPTAIVKPGRMLIKRGVLNKVSRKEVHVRYFILFNDVLFYLTPVMNGMFKLKEELPLLNMQVEVSQNFRFEFIVRSVKRSFALLAKDKQEMEEWVKDLRSAIGEYTEKQQSFNKVLHTSPRFSGGQFTSLSDQSFDNVSECSSTIDIENSTLNAASTVLSEDLQSLDHQSHQKPSSSTDLLRTSQTYALGDLAPVWVHDNRVTMCQVCTKPFNLLNRRHHCRACGLIICSDCSANQYPLKYMDYKADRVCDNCFEYFSLNPNHSVNSNLNSDQLQSQQQMLHSISSTSMHSQPSVTSSTSISLSKDNIEMIDEQSSQKSKTVLVNIKENCEPLLSLSNRKNRSNSCHELQRNNIRQQQSLLFDPMPDASLNRNLTARSSSRIIKTRNVPNVLLEVAANDHQALISGYLQRFSSSKRQWKLFWFVIKNLVLYTFKASEDVRALETLPLPGFDVDISTESIKGYPASLIIKLSHRCQSTIYFFTENPDNLKKWLRAFNDSTSL